jgi:DNA-binding transcriptional LysR family regulator
MARQIIELGNNEAVKRPVAAGVGVGIRSKRTLDVEAQAGDIGIRDCADRDCRRQFWPVHPRDRLLSRAE